MQDIGVIEMAKSSSSSGASVPSPMILITVLAALAVVIGMGGLVAGVIRLLSAGQSGEFGVLTLLTSALWLVAGLTVAALLCAVAWLVAQSYELAGTGRQMLAAIQDLESIYVASPTTAGDKELIGQVLAHLSEINENQMLSHEQRQEKRRREQEELAESHLSLARQAIEVGDFAQAEKALANLAEDVPDHPDFDVMAARLAEMRDVAAARQLRREIAAVEELISASLFDQARAEAKRLVDANPDSPEAVELLQRVIQKAQDVLNRQRNDLYKEIRRLAEDRDWEAALSAARRLLTEHPGSREADIVAPQLPTLEDNARIEKVRRLRDAIRQRIDRREFAAAAEMAEEVIYTYPDTQAASELRGQIGRLRQLAVVGSE